MSLFITFEGIEGCGKTTQINHLTSYLERIHKPLLVTREPGGTEVGEKIRQILLSSENDRIDPMAELLLYAASRVQHYREVISSALAQGKIVLCDRFADATLAYQGYGRGLDLEWIEKIHSQTMANVRPNLTFLLDLPVEEGLKRAFKRMENQTNKEDRFEKEALDFHRRVREGYLVLAKRDPKRIIILDGLKDEQTLHREIISHLPEGLRG
ncbi:MAG: dTMP kinase [Thermodesulfobacteriota bacterium]|nr:dTMP kinase [Thermodesulfobacteriota bacterium]